jgi:hypothetical protein
MSNDHIKSEISAYLTGGLTESRMCDIDAHIASCEKCRHALGKARTKQARVRREALKKATADPLPNLFLARQGKDVGLDRPSSRSPWILITGLVLVGAAYGLYRHFSTGPQTGPTPAVTSDPTLAVMSSTPAISSTSVKAAVAPLAKVPPAPEPIPAPLEVKREWKGSDSGIKISRIVVIRSDRAWENLWIDMQEKEPLPSIDFDQSTIIGIFAGGRSLNAAVKLGQIRQNDKSVIVPYSFSGAAVAETIPTVSASTSAVSASTFGVAAPTLAVVAPSHPYLLSMIPRVDKKIRVTQREVP